MVQILPIMRDKTRDTVKVQTFRWSPAHVTVWCKGSTSDFDSLSIGSNPVTVAKRLNGVRMSPIPPAAIYRELA